MEWSDLTFKEKKQIYDGVRKDNPDATYFDIKKSFDIPAYENGEEDVAASYSLPEVEIYPQNRFGDIARTQGLQTARNWKSVREGTTKGINDFVSDTRTQFVLATAPLPSGFEGVEAATNMIGETTSKVGKYLQRNTKSFLSKTLKNKNKLKIDQIKDLSKLSDSDWDDLYNIALNSGDSNELQKIRDLHFKTKAPNTKMIDSENNPMHLYHGTNSKFNSIDESLYGKTDGGTFGTGFYTSPNKDYARNYGKNILDIYSNIKKPVDVRGYELSDLMYAKMLEGKNVYRGWEYIGGAKSDGVLGGYAALPKNKTLLEVVTHSPKNVKYAKPITYDDFGNIIPISKRDNFNINDLRYGLIPLGFGIGYNYLNNDESNSTPSYKYGGIHIKKKNRGKFNALKKRTGKTTEELTHSKNPLTRKRAIFAQNAKKWNKNK